TSNGSVRSVTVKVFTVGTPPSGSFVLRTAIVEDWIHYTNPPGTNGEKDFPAVFRDMLPNTSGDAYTPAAQGDSVTFTYQYTLDMGNWDTTQIYAISFVQNTSTKEIIQSGSSWDPNWEFTADGTTFLEGSASNTSTFSSALYYNLSGASGNFRFKLTTEHPAGWAANFSINSSTYADSADVVLNGHTSGTVTLNVIPGNIPAVGNYYLIMQSLDNPSFAPQVIEFHVISDVTDLIVNNDAGWGDGNQYDWSADYLNGLNYAGNTNYAPTNTGVFVKGQEANQLTGVNNIYFNVSWTFPSLTDANVASLQSFLDNGGNLYISGQDIGWDTWDPNGNGTANTKSFYTNYLHAKYLSDGSSANNNLDAVTADGIFGNVNSSALVDIYGGNMYPEELDTVGGSVPIFNYNSGSKIAGLRAYETSGPYKIVYLGVDLHMVSDTNVRKEIVKISHDWFYNLVGEEDFDRAIMALSSGQNYPNPASDITTIPIYNLNRDAVLQISDVTGTIIREVQVLPESSFVNVDVSALAGGSYFYRIITPGETTAVKPMQVVR
ncbi:MAG: T9SS type A sorting domain-containing protein, partial [Flavobacteriales bacterium]